MCSHRNFRIHQKLDCGFLLYLLIFFELQIIEGMINAVLLGQQILVAALLCNAVFGQDDDSVGIFDGG